MSHNDNNLDRAARRHRPAIWGIGIALLAAVIALMVFAPWRDRENQPTGEIAPPATVAPAAPAPATPATSP